MEPGTRFCPNHPGLKFPPFAQECTVCNRVLNIFGIPESLSAVPFQTDEVAEQPVEEFDKELHKETLKAFEKRPFKEFRGKIEDKIAEKKAKKGKK